MLYLWGVVGGGAYKACNTATAGAINELVKVKGGGGSSYLRDFAKRFSW